MSDECFVFLDDSNNELQEVAVNHIQPKIGKILTVDDDVSYQQSLLYSLNNFVIGGEPVEILTANSATEAASVLAQHNDIAIILLDVVMEQDDAGLRLVETIRNVQGNALIRIILLTGQPGLAPRKDVMRQYDIDEYWNKSEIDHDTLRSVVAANFRSWQSMYKLEQARIGLQMVVDASRHLASKYETSSFIDVVLKEIASLIGYTDILTLCVAKVARNTSYEDATVIASAGINELKSSELLPEFLVKKFGKLCAKALEQCTHQFNKHQSVLCFPVDHQNSGYYLVLAHTQQSLSDYHINLLQVFSENISSGFMQISLVNQLSNLAYQDSELHINNQNWLLRELHLMNDADLSKSELVILSIDNFDSHALSFSEEYLHEIVEAVYKNIIHAYNPTVGIARISSGTFVILYNKRFTQTDKVLRSLSNQSNVIHGETVNCTLTIARMDLSYMQGFPALQILHLAKSLLYYGRQQRAELITYHPSYREHLLDDYQLVSDLKNAIANHEFYLTLQPKVDLRNGLPIGFEALIRWRKNQEVIPPNVFIPLAERSGLITQLDLMVIDLTVEAIQQLEQAGFSLPVSFNATVKDLSDPEYVQHLKEAVSKEEINSDLFDIEITETQAMESYELINPTLEALHSLGMHVSIDDFGTGYSSLSHISKLAADTIKIDIAFVTDLGEDKANQKVVELVMSLASLLGFSVVAEGVETEQQRKALLEKGCFIGQGYLYAKPMPIDELLVWLNHVFVKKMEQTDE